MSLWNHLVGAEAHKAGQALTDAAINLVGSDIASAAQMQTLEDALGERVRLLSGAELKFHAEEKKMAAIDTAIANAKTALGMLQSQVAGSDTTLANPESTAAQRTTATTGRDRAMDQAKAIAAALKNLAPQHDDEAQALADAKGFYDNAKAAVDAAGKVLASAKSTIAHAQVEDDRAKLQRKRAEEKQHQQEQLAHLTNADDGMNAVLASMQRRTAANQEAALTATHMAEQLSAVAHSDAAGSDVVAQVLAQSAAPATEDPFAALKS